MSRIREVSKLYRYRYDANDEYGQKTFQDSKWDVPNPEWPPPDVDYEGNTGWWIGISELDDSLGVSSPTYPDGEYNKPEFIDGDYNEYCGVVIGGEEMVSPTGGDDDFQYNYNPEHGYGIYLMGRRDDLELPPHVNPCAYDTHIHPRWNFGYDNIWGEDWFRDDVPGKYGFAALPGGVRRFDGLYTTIGILGMWLTSTENEGNVETILMYSGLNSILNQSYDKTYGGSIRCVRDAVGGELIYPDGHQYGNDYEDGNGNKYDAVKIGDQIWTKRNLKTTKYQNGNDIITGLDDSAWNNTTSGAYAIYPYDHEDFINGNSNGIESEQDVIDAYGLLYNFYAVDNGLVNNNNYRVPSNGDWNTLINYLIGNEQYGLNSQNVAISLKSCRQVDHPNAE